MPSTFRLACFPHVVGSSAPFLLLSELLLPTVEVVALRYPDTGGNCPVPRIADPEVLADSAFETLVKCTDRPLALFGHRIGAHIAYRVAQRLEHEAGTIPTTLFVSGQEPPPRAPGEAAARPALSCPVVALAGSRGGRPVPAGAEEWKRCTDGRFGLEVFPGEADYFRSGGRQLVNLIHDQLISLPGRREKTRDHRGPDKGSIPAPRLPHSFRVRDVP
ncbi:thioesterase II family protein [Streptomyces cinnamoneus]|uniref:thioesterase II family protein n=1 Tax=Streptomyces cinnamoneus TaxID=53446 RepID=UPI001EFD8CFF|nr:thioesterase domain-containing protein [Streptomyces cinnamoneus]